MKRRVGSVPLALALAAAAAGCATSGGGGGGGGGGAGNVLTHEQLQATSETDLYLVIDRLRPRWLRARGASSFGAPAVVMLFVDNAPRGSVAELRGIHVNDIQEVRYYSATEAATRYGTTAGSGGAVVVTTRR